MIRGIGTSKGIGMGRALIVESPQMEISVKKIEDTAAEQERYKKAKADRKSTRLNSSHTAESRMPSSA